MKTCYQSEALRKALLFARQHTHGRVILLVKMNRLMKLLPQEFYANAGSRSTDSACESCCIRTDWVIHSLNFVYVLVRILAPIGDDGFKNEAVGQQELTFERGLQAHRLRPLLRRHDDAARRQRLLALSVVVYYGFKLQRLHKDLRFVWSNKGRFSWVKSNSDFNTMDS